MDGMMAFVFAIGSRRKHLLSQSLNLCRLHYYKQIKDKEAKNGSI